MEITRSVVSERDRGLLGGDHSTYHSQAARRIHTLRKRLGTATPRARKYTTKAPVSAGNIAQNSEWVQLLLASSERSWASAMSMKSSQSAENTQKAMAGSTKRQIASRLRRAIKYAENLVTVLQDRKTTASSEVDILEAKAYLALMRGSLDFEKTRWQICLQHYSVARIIYVTLSSSAKTDIFKDLLSGIVDPSIRYAAYQLKVPRTKPVPEIAIENFPSTEAETREEIKAVDPEILAFQSEEVKASREGLKDLPSNISWRGRTVKIEDAAISQALGVAQEREDLLSSTYESSQKGSLNPKELVAAYDGVIDARQDAVDSTKTAIDELAAEGVDPGDPRMQSLQVTRTAVNYAVIEWRIARNRLLCGSQDGLTFEPEKAKVARKESKDRQIRVQKNESSGRKLSRLRERVALYDSILQSLDAVKDLPGVLSDTAFVEELNGKRAYFRALKCLAIGRSHAIGGTSTDALALYARALDLAKQAASTKATTTSSSVSSPDQPPKLDLSTPQVNAATTHLTALVTRHRALVDLQNIQSSQSKTKTQAQSQTPPQQPPLIDRLHLNQYDATVDATNLVTYPPQLQPVPVKPLFFDLAWNYIAYPGKEKPDGVGADEKGHTVATKVANEEEKKEPQQTQKGKGWFPFGR